MKGVIQLLLPQLKAGGCPLIAVLALNPGHIGITIQVYPLRITPPENPRRVSVRTWIIGMWLVLSFGLVSISAQQSVTSPEERRVTLSESAVAFDALGRPALEATLQTTGLNGSRDTPVKNVRMIIKNTEPFAYAFVSGQVSFYDSSGLRCGDGLFTADLLTVNESVEVDSPGIRITCSPSTWRIMATNLVPRIPPGITVTPSPNLLISVDGEEHPIQLNKPMVVIVGETRRTIIVRAAP